MIAVTGASGFLGRRLVLALARAGLPICALVRADRVRDLSWTPPVSLEARRWSAGERAHLHGVSAIVHAAAHRPARYDDPTEAERCLQVNALATQLLLEDAARNGVEHFVYVGAGNVYAPLDRPARESDPVWPSHRAVYYLGSKICGEFFASAEAARGRMRVTAVRPSAIYGPGMPAGLVATFVSRLRAGQPVTVADGGRYRADLVYVDDVADAIVSLLSRRLAGTFNLGSGATVSSLQLAFIVCDALSRDRGLVEIQPETGEAPGFMALDIERARSAFGYAPRDVVRGIGAMLKESGE